MRNWIAQIAFSLVLAMVCGTARVSRAQMMDDDVDGLQLKDITQTTSRLTWKAVDSVPCDFSITYSVFRGTTDTFEPGPENVIASDLKGTSYITHEKPNVETYYHVRAVRNPDYCAPPALSSGRLLVYPLDLGKAYEVTVAETSEACVASSPSELTCKTLQNFHAVLAQQAGHEFLIGCLESEYESGGWSCVNLTTGMYSVAVHSKTLTFINAGFSKQNTRTGKTLSAVIPVFSALGTIY